MKNGTIPKKNGIIWQKTVQNSLGLYKKIEGGFTAALHLLGISFV